MISSCNDTNYMSPTNNCVEVRKDGGTVYLSEIGLFTEEDKLAQFYTSKDRHNNKLIPKDGVFGKKIEFDHLTINKDPSLDKPKTRMWFRDVIDVNEYDGVEINGVKYTEE